MGIGEPPVAERGVGGLVSRLGRALAGGLVSESINQFTDPPSQRDHAQPSDQPTRILVGVDSTGGRQTQTDGLAPKIHRRTCIPDVNSTGGRQTQRDGLA